MFVVVRRDEVSEIPHVRPKQNPWCHDTGLERALSASAPLLLLLVSDVESRVPAPDLAAALERHGLEDLMLYPPTPAETWTLQGQERLFLGLRLAGQASLAGERAPDAEP